ncbi:SDR family NAD(P)-dependent oxidoreductase [Nocardia sp. NPDC050378]|uniref:SDR family NAD(P)-dependent oxidoreductase n=1 Tax=Nocardia sp. NPDC050378 TaxID=3155400 RepID=UPI0033E89C7C
MNGRFAGKVVVVTGTGGGQGRAAALALAEEGATVIGCDMKTDGAEETRELVTAKGATMTSAQPLDLADRAAVSAWIDDAVREHGGIDLLYNNASAPRFAPFAEMTPADWHATLRNELDVVFHVTQLVWPHMIARGGGAIVNIASIQGVNALRWATGGTAHATTKHGILGLTRELAAAGGPHNIRVNAICPGLIRSPATEKLTQNPDVLDTVLGHQIIQRIGQPEDVVRAALFLLSDHASFITGDHIMVDGGYTII